MSRGPSQGEALATWALWGLIALCVIATYSRIDPSETYHVSREGIAGGLSRALTLVNFPFGLVAIALVLIAAAALPRSAWWAAAPAIGLCATIPWFNEQKNLDAHWGNAIPALGVVIAAVLTAAATRRAGPSLASRRPWDTARVIIVAVVLLISLPWLSAELGFHFPGDVFMGEEIIPEKDGTLIAAVHLGHHHGEDGALLLITALLLSRVFVETRGLRIAITSYLGLMLSYGAVNCVQDAWNEQFVKRGWTDARIPSAILPSASPIWLVIVALAVLSTVSFSARTSGRHTPPHDAGADDLPRFREVRARGQDLRARAHYGRRSRGRPPDAGVGRRRGRAARGITDRAHDPPRDGP